MAQSRSIENVLPEINNSIFLPPIQREFVWDKNQIVKLFDSIMRDYPIGSFLFWNVNEENVDDKIKYKFVENYVEDKIFPEKIHRMGEHHNEKVDERYEELPKNISLVLDGQQRLSAFYIGLKGSYIDRRRHTYKSKAKNYRKKKLYLNVLNNPSKEGKLDMKYEFKFIEPEPSNKEGEYWYRVENILNVTEKYDEIEEVKNKVKKELDKEKVDGSIINKNIGSLYDAVCQEKYITYFEESTTSEDRVLDVFVRANEGGTKLSKPDLVLSIASSSWKEEFEEIEDDKPIVAREKILEFVDELNNHSVRDGGDFGVRFVLQSLLACCEEPLSFSYRNIDNKNRLINMKKVWQQPRFKKAVEKTFNLVEEYGLTLSFINKKALIPIVYAMYMYNYDIDSASKVGRENRENILYYILSSTLNDVFSSKVPQVSKRICESIKSSNNQTFPIKEIEKGVNKYDKSINFDENTIRNKFEKYDYKSSKKTYAMLYLLYFPETANIPVEIDHMFPKSKLKLERLIEEEDIPHKQAEEMNKIKDRIGNLQLIRKETNRSKGDTSFENWHKSRIRKDKFTPETDYGIKDFPKFVEEREEKMISYIVKNYSEI